MTDPFTAVGTRRVILALLLGGLLMLAYAVLQLFLVPVAWAAIMAYATWPLYLRVRRVLSRKGICFAAHEGHPPRPLQEKAMTKSCPHSPQRAQAKPWARMPHSR